MNGSSSCRCCLARPPDKDLKSLYTCLGKTEVYGDMLKECFEIHLMLETCESDNGICEVCISRLRDACDFKQQVMRCQAELQMKMLDDAVKDEDVPKIKMEYSDMEENENGIYFLELKEEVSDFEDLKEDEKIAEMLGLDDVTMKRKTCKKKNNKKRLTIDESRDRKSKTIKIKSPLKLSLRALSQIEQLNDSVTSDICMVSENKKHCQNVEKILKYSNCTPFSNKTLAGIVCAYCKETYQNPDDLRSHTKKIHKSDDLNYNKRLDKSNLSIKMDISDLKCTVCGAGVDTITNLKKHLTIEHDIKFYPDVYDYILEFKLSDSDLLDCALCNSTFETFKMLLQHMNGHYRNYICDICDMGFINKHRLKNHQRTHEIGTFKCSYCDKVFGTHVRKMCHEKYTHNTNARYTTNCPHCDQSFTSYYQRNRHMFNEHNIAAATYKCNICDKSFILKSKLTSHIKKVHLMERNHICSECGQGFFIKQSLDEHMIKHNGERVFKCTVCHKAYARKKTLREHMRIHNNDRRFKCGVCGLAFVQKCSLKSHMLSNHGLTLSEFENSSKLSP
ncbi:zinc finger and SCAN domain-containing protein 12-like [Danaus plexippus]|uniref:zinc finger and SCAN domain-containing protein 12-like n=1 Tax=Danaus plexippus TaxID=13037 RepID=UPI002AB13808|nr:zinc finger and SCAN domain-containing protein 12-like [Danaus plexippus]